MPEKWGRGVSSRLQGLTYDQIAALTGYANASGPCKAVQRARERPRHLDQGLDAHIEHQRLETLHQVPWAELDSTPRRRNQLITRVFRIGELEGDLTANFTVDLPPLSRRRPVRPVGVWTDALALRANGATLEAVARRLGLSDPSAARKRLCRDLDDHAAGPAARHHAIQADRLDALQRAVWEAATSNPVSLGAVDVVLKIISRRIDPLGLAPADPTKTKPKRRRQGRPQIPPLTGRENIHTYPLPLRTRYRTINTTGRDFLPQRVSHEAQRVNQIKPRSLIGGIRSGQLARTPPDQAIRGFLPA